MTEPHADISSLLIACIDWFRFEPTRIKYCREVLPGVSALTRRIFHRTVAFDFNAAHEYCDRASEAVKARDLEACQKAMVELRSELSKPMRDVEVYGGKDYSLFLTRFIRMLGSDFRFEAAQENVIRLWFDMTHSWRKKAAKGVPTIPDFSQFMLVETIATAVLIWLGIILPMIRPQTEGLYRLAPPILFIAFAIPTALSGLTRNFDLRQVFYWLFVGIGIIPVRILKPLMSDWILWSWGGGIIFGVLIGNHLALKRSRRWATKNGPFACLWARHIHNRNFELLLVRADGTPVWRYRVFGWMKHVCPVLGANLTICLRGITKRMGYESQPGEGWFPCYPALVATRMVGMRRRNPVGWREARISSPGLTDEVIDEFFSHTPSIIQPPPQALALSAVTLPWYRGVPW